MYDYVTKSAKTVAVVCTVLAPAPLLAGAYGSSAVRDSNVSNTATATATVPCPRLGQPVPANLAAQMDCNRATPRVAGERVRNRTGITSIFERFPHNRQGPEANADDDDGDPRVVVTTKPDPHENVEKEPHDNGDKDPHGHDKDPHGNDDKGSHGNDKESLAAE